MRTQCTVRRNPNATLAGGLLRTSMALTECAVDGLIVGSPDPEECYEIVDGEGNRVDEMPTLGALRHSAATLCSRCQTPTYADAAWNADRGEPVCSDCTDALRIIGTVREPAEYPYHLRLSWPPIIRPWKPIEEYGDRRLVRVEPVPPALKLIEKWCGYSPTEWFTTHGEQPLTQTSCYSQFGALEFMTKRIAHGAEAYMPLPRPLDRYIDWLFYRPLNLFIPVEVLVRVEPRFGSCDPLHIGKPFAKADWFLEQFLKLVQDNKRSWPHEHPDFGAKQAGSYPTYERKFWWMQGRLIGESAEGEVTEPTNEIERILASVQQSRRFISRPLRTCYSENNVAIPVHFDVIPAPKEDWSPFRCYDSFPVDNRTKVRTSIWDDETFRWVSLAKLRLLLTRKRTPPIFGLIKSLQPLQQATKEELSGWNAILLKHHLPSEPPYTPGSGVTYFEPPDGKVYEELSDVWDSSPQAESSPDDESAETLWEKNLSDGADYFDPGNQRETTSEINDSARELQQLLDGIRRKFKIEGKRTDELKAAILSDPDSKSWKYTVKMITEGLSTEELKQQESETAKANTLIKRLSRAAQRLNEFRSVADTCDPDFMLAVQGRAGQTIEEGWYVALRLTGKPVLYPIDAHFEVKFPLGSSTPTIKHPALEQLRPLRKTILAEAVRKAQDTPGSKSTKARAVRAARQRISKAFAQVQCIYLLPTFQVPFDTEDPLKG